MTAWACVNQDVPGVIAGAIGYTPVLDPLDVHGAWWVLLIPLAVLISIAYKAVRVREMRHYGRDVAVMTVQILAGMLLLGAAVYLLIELVVPAIGPMPGR